MGMTRRGYAALCAGIAVAALAAEGRSAVAAEPSFNTVGIYVSPPAKNQAHYLDFYRACGYNYLEFCEAGFSRRPDKLPAYHADFAASIAAAQKKGFRVWVLLLAGMKQWKGPGATGNAGTFSALDEAELAERLERIEEAVKALRGADGFQFFAGDPGGDPLGRSTVHDCMAFARKVQAIVRSNAPRARFAVNVWAIAEWAGFPSPFSFTFWQKQVELARAVAKDPSMLGPECGAVFSMDNYYRSLTLTTYADAGVTPEPYPVKADIDELRARGVTPLLGWPYFLVDECDDGFVTPNNVVTGGQSQAETRYIRSIVNHGLAAGLDGLVTNAAYVSAEPLNIYVFARMCRDPKLTPEKALEEYAGIVATDATRAALVRVLQFIENHCNWQNSLPAMYRLPNFALADPATPRDAMALLATVKPRTKARIVLPEPPVKYLERLMRRLETIERGEIGGPNPAYVPEKKQ